MVRESEWISETYKRQAKSTYRGRTMEEGSLSASFSEESETERINVSFLLALSFLFITVWFIRWKTRFQRLRLGNCVCNRNNCLWRFKILVKSRLIRICTVNTVSYQFKPGYLLFLFKKNINPTRLIRDSSNSTRPGELTPHCINAYSLNGEGAVSLWGRR